MSRKIRMALMAAGFLVVGVFAQGAAAQIAQDGAPARYINTGLFTVAPGEGVNFHVSLDDRREPLRRQCSCGCSIRTVRWSHARTSCSSQGSRRRSRLPNRVSTGRTPQVLEPPASSCERRTFIGTVEIFRAMNTSRPPDDKPELPVSRMSFAHDDGRSCGGPE